MKNPGLQRNLAAVSVAACAVVAASPALATPSSGVTPTLIVNGHFGKLDVKTESAKTDHWGLMVKSKDDTDVGSDRVSLQAGGFTGWHAHPAPVFVTVTQGSIVWYNGTDPVCPSHTYTAGQSLIEDAYVIHYVKNASTSSPAEYVAIRINPTGVGFRIDEPKPTNCK